MLFLKGAAGGDAQLLSEFSVIYRVSVYIRALGDVSKNWGILI